MMGKPHPVELRPRVVDLVAEGNTHRSAAARFRTSVMFVNDRVKLRQTSGGRGPKPPCTQASLHPSLLAPKPPCAQASGQWRRAWQADRSEGPGRPPDRPKAGPDCGGPGRRNHRDAWHRGAAWLGLAASRINRRLCTMPWRNPASISRTATSGSIPGRPNPSEQRSATAPGCHDRSRTRVHPNQHMIVRDQIAQRPADQKLQLIPFLPPQHRPPQTSLIPRVNQTPRTLSKKTLDHFLTLLTPRGPRLDGAGWHGARHLAVPGTAPLLPLPPALFAERKLRCAAPGRYW